MTDDTPAADEDVAVPDGEYRAVLDRIEDGLATLILEADEEAVGQALVAPERLPADARHTDAVVTVTVEDGGLVACRYEDEATDRRHERVQSRFDRLASRREESDRGTTPDEDPTDECDESPEGE